MRILKFYEICGRKLECVNFEKLMITKKQTTFTLIDPIHARLFVKILHISMFDLHWYY